MWIIQHIMKAIKNDDSGIHCGLLMMVHATSASCQFWFTLVLVHVGPQLWLRTFLSWVHIRASWDASREVVRLASNLPAALTLNRAEISGVIRDCIEDETRR